VRRGGVQSGPPHASMVPALRGAAAAILEAGEGAMLRVGRQPEAGGNQSWRGWVSPLLRPEKQGRPVKNGV